MTTDQTETGFGLPSEKRIGFDHPWAWLAAGYRDMKRSPHVSLSYGALFAAMGCLLTYGLYELDAVYVALPLAAGFMLMGPLLAVGLYEVSRRHAAGEKVTLGAALGAWRRDPGGVFALGFVLMLVFLLWIRIATLLFALFYGVGEFHADAFVSETFFSFKTIWFLITGIGIGAVFATIVFSMSAIAFPMIIDRKSGDGRHPLQPARGRPQLAPAGPLGRPDRRLLDRRPRGRLYRPDLHPAPDRPRELSRLPRPGRVAATVRPGTDRTHTSADGRVDPADEGALDRFTVRVLGVAIAQPTTPHIEGDQIRDEGMSPKSVRDRRLPAVTSRAACRIRGRCQDASLDDASVRYHHSWRCAHRLRRNDLHCRRDPLGARLRGDPASPRHCLLTLPDADRHRWSGTLHWKQFYHRGLG